MTDTLLALDGIGVAPYSARGLTENLRPTGAGALRRTVNGDLEDVTEAQFRKYAVTIDGDDQRSPAVDGIWKGTVVTVDCITALSYPTATGSPQRTVVPGSSFVEGDFTFYRPRLVCRVVDFKIRTDEWGAAVGWTLEMEEV